MGSFNTNSGTGNEQILNPLGTVPLVTESPLALSDRPTETRVERGLRADLQQLAALTELVSHVATATSADEACSRLAHELIAYCPARYIIVGLFHPRTRQTETSTIAAAEQIATPAKLTIAAAAAMEECLARGKSGHWPPSKDNRNCHALFAHQQLGQLCHAAPVLSMPLLDADDNICGACLVIGLQEGVASNEFSNFLRASSRPLGSALRLIRRANGNRFDRLANRCTSFAHTNRAKLALLVAAILVCVLSLPVRYQVYCDCELQPVTRRYIAVPFDARLQQSHVEPGDHVMSGQLLAQLDASDIQLDLSARRSELHRVAKQLDGYVAAHESGKSEIARLEMQRIQLAVTQLEEQSLSLEIRSPIDGIVLLGDHSKSEGVPLEKGKTLFEIGPLDRMVIELEIPEDDVRFVRTGQSAQIRLDAFPRESVHGTLLAVHPRAELRDHRNVFIGEITIDNDRDQVLRPGMRGNASIQTVRKSLAWNYFHKPYAAILTWFKW